MEKQFMKNCGRYFAVWLIICQMINISWTGKQETARAETAAKPQTTLSAPAEVRLRNYKGKRLRLRWSDVAEADSYEIFQYRKKKKAYRKVAEVEGGRTSWLSPRTRKAMRYKIRACCMVNGKKEKGAFSYAVCAIPYARKKGKKVNAGIVRAKQYQNQLGIYENKQMEVSIRTSRYAKNKRAKVFDTSLRWYTTDAGIATVDSKGKVTTGGKYGTCQIYARAHNGNTTGKINITVKNYARPGKFTNTEYTEENMRRLLTDYAEDLQVIAEYFERYNKTHDPQEVKFYMNMGRSAMIVDGADVPYEEVKERLYRILDDCPGDMVIHVTRGGVHFELSNNMYNNELSFSMNIIPAQKEVEEGPSNFRVAARWFYSFYRYA